MEDTGLGMRPIRVQILFLPLIRCVTLSMKCAAPFWTSVSPSVGWRSPPSYSRGSPVQPAFHSTKSRAWGVLLPRVNAVVEFTYIIRACRLGGHEWLLGRWSREGSLELSHLSSYFFPLSNHQPPSLLQDGCNSSQLAS